ncbi:odorant receptor 131-2-like [Leptodactylus fuscus]|uniref:odorant receptor 131-2-like n=1 Tax=Leptodactylus fuscus TaxID=238119 RepID=UPI003F4E98E7
MNISPPKAVNSSQLQTNLTQVSVTSDQLLYYLMGILEFLILVGFGFFIYFITMILIAFFSTQHIRDKARYVLFIYMLCNDALFLFLGFFSLVAFQNGLYIYVPICYILYIISAVTFKVTPYNLAAMAIEQYVAICHPLRHVELCTTFRAHVTFTMICSLSIIPLAVELYVMLSSFTNIFNLYIICFHKWLIVNPIQDIIRSVSYILCFSFVGIVILFTYVKIMLVARRLRSRSSSASKAGKTVMLHAFQLLLSMTSILSISSESLPVVQNKFRNTINFYIFTCMPRFISPVIYGIRDETLKKYIRRSLPHFFQNLLGKNKGNLSR